MDDAKAKAGRARAASLSKEERQAIGKQAAMARWLPQATYSGDLTIGDMKFPCSVLSDGTRILTQSDFMNGMGMYYSGWVARSRRDADGADAELPLFLAFKSLKPFIDKHLGDLQSIVVKYRTERGNVAHVGIVALVDEATGYQKDRAADALANILEAFIAKELQPWVRTFPDDYYEQLFRLRGLDYPAETVKRPQYFGHLTNDIVYRRLAPRVLDELKRTTPKTPSGRLKHQLHRRLTPDLGHPKLREHMASVVTVMKLSDDYDDFRRKLDRVHPRYHETMSMDFINENEEEESRGI